MERSERNTTRAGARGHKNGTAKVKLPINLLRKAKREQRNRGETTGAKESQPKTRQPRKPDAARLEHSALVQATERELQSVLAGTELLSDVPYDSTPVELLGEIALAKGSATIVYVQRDGLSTLTIPLAQSNPTIANLKRAIEAVARVQLGRELRQRTEERRKRRRQSEIVASPIDGEEERQRQQHINSMYERQAEHCGSTTAAVRAWPAQARSTGELVCSAARNGHHHRPNVSWRFLWRAFALFNVDTNLPLNDEDGRKLLAECGIENASTLKFCKRENYFGRKRQ